MYVEKLTHKKYDVVNAAVQWFLLLVPDLSWCCQSCIDLIINIDLKLLYLLFNLSLDCLARGNQALHTKIKRSNNCHSLIGIVELASSPTAPSANYAEDSEVGQIYQRNFI